VEGEYIVPNSDDIKLVELPVLVSRVDGGHEVTIPENVNEGIGLTGLSAECTGLEERDRVVVAGVSVQWCCRSERSREIIRAAA